MTDDQTWAAELALSLFESCIDQEAIPAIPDSIRLVEDRERFFHATRFFRLVLCILVLFHDEDRDPRLGWTRGSLETKAAADGISPEDIHWGMNILLELLSAEKGQAKWAQRWFAEIGIELWNPVTLHLFAFAWMDMYLTLRRSIGFVIDGRTQP